MSGAADSTRDRLLGISEVLRLLNAEFPDVTISKIRFLETEKLVEPRRTPSGYRKFRSEDVERLQYILRAQRDHYLPLRVIREHLDALDRGLRPSSAGGEAPVVPLPLPDSGTGGGPGVLPSELRLSRRELLQAAGVEDTLLRALEEHGLVRVRRSGPKDTVHYGGEAVRIAMAAARMQEYGIEPRHLRTVRSAAEREVGLIEQAVRPLFRRGDDLGPAEAGRELAGLSAQLHAALLHAALEATLPLPEDRS